MNNTCFTFPSSAPGQAAWVADPSCRGTFGIALLCLSTTIICIWSSVHRDIPLKRLPTIRSLIRDAPLVLVALFAPELMFYFALNQYLCARSLVKAAEKNLKVEPKANLKQVGGTGRCARVVKAFFAALRALLGNKKSNYARVGDMPSPVKELPDSERGEIALPNVTSEKNSSLNGTEEEDQPPQAGSQVSASNSSSQPLPGQNTSTPRRQHPFTLKHGFYATMGGFAIKHIDGNGVENSPRERLDRDGVQQLMEQFPDSFPDLSLESITDREKSTNLAKALLIVQVLWFCLNCISRLAERLPLSLLEVTTLAHGLFTLLSYAMWWSKPLNVEEPTWITRPSRIYLSTESSSVPKFADLLDSVGLRTLGSRLRARCADFAVTAIVPFVYGFLHFLATKAQFPTTIERGLWRIAAIVVMSSGVLEATIDSFYAFTSASPLLGGAVLLIVIPSVYTVCSGYLLVASFRQLWYLPHDAYVVASWSYYIPHWL